MNLRTLKKLSKRAAPLILLLGDDRQQFTATKGEDHHETFIGDRKHWDRRRCAPNYKGRNDWGISRGAEIVFTTRKGNQVVMHTPWHPRKGTIMVGAISGYYQPEWDEKDAWSALDNIVRSHFELYSDEGDFLGLSRVLKTPKHILVAALEILANTQSGDRKNG
ncbi:iron-containing alcohol dehydrogenase family protein [Ochrobactrum sp. MR28]|nr:iron-containing alcohol dehydrogenase family protein [Ochrobactrum sp. MR28]MBX8818967.1 iron-containing alcohol dehydrogenase family protein [Ochrobactrum sp. MR31]